MMRFILAGLATLDPSLQVNASEAGATASLLPTSLDRYHDPVGASLWDVLAYRVGFDHFNLVALAIFVCAIVHTFLTAKIRYLAHVVEERHATKVKDRKESEPANSDNDGQPDEVSFGGQVLHFLGEIEAVFGIWVIVLAGAITWFKGWDAVVGYISGHVSYTEPLFVVIVMALAATRPVLVLAERCLSAVAGLGRQSPGAWWLVILIIAPLLGSLITEPAAMTIAALLLSRQFYDLKPSPPLAYSTIGLLFVNVSVGGTLTHFAAPPVIVIANTWNWGLLHMLTHFGLPAVVGIVASTLLYYVIFRSEFAALSTRVASRKTQGNSVPIPAWITIVQLGFLAFTVWQAHRPVMFIGAFLFFLAFTQATAHHQSPVDLKSPILVGFFLAGLVIHGGLQAWWIEPILSRLGELPLFISSTMLTAFNDNAAITFLASLVPGFTEPLKYAVVAGAVTGGGLTVIANAPNPAGQAILSRYFPGGVAPLRLLFAALAPTVIMAACFMTF
jgi:Na+/H+ antiporter NhaD/arsenite permease-like protein